jgi:hypothetical protein
MHFYKGAPIKKIYIGTLVTLDRHVTRSKKGWWYVQGCHHQTLSRILGTREPQSGTHPTATLSGGRRDSKVETVRKISNLRTLGHLFYENPSIDEIGPPYSNKQKCSR